MDKDRWILSTTSKSTSKSNKLGSTLYVALEIVESELFVQLKHMFSLVKY